MERSLGLAFTTLTIFAPLAQASHPQQAVRPEGTASPLEFVATAPDHRGLVFARQVLPAARPAGQAAHAAEAPPRALSRVLYLNRDGVILRPGDNDSARQRSSIVAEPTAIDGWDVDDDTWAATVACVAEIYAPFDVAVTDVDPGDVPHIEAVFGGSPGDVGLPDNVAGVSPFTEDCAIIEDSIVFTFTGVLPDDPRTVCEVTAQEIAHSFGLDHEMLPSDPMTYLDYDGERTFQDEMASCGEFADRTCGVNGLMCRRRQNSVALLEERLGRRGAGAGGAGTDHDGTAGPGAAGGCTAAGGGSGLAMALAWLGVRRRRRR
ncbi:MAG TPA: hypothetical protein VFT22_20470 [Kofleriaceae bacterium]|nr:hypothetical protein [Kofleriaceae bacterium]